MTRSRRPKPLARAVFTALAALLAAAPGPAPAAVPAAAPAAAFDAIVIDDDLGGAGGNGDYAVGQGPTAREARRIAMSNCRAGGNVACTPKLTYRQCGAYASGGGRSGTGTGASMEAAAAAALASCGQGACRLVVADCVGTPLRPPR